jgi:hypothetical protein
MGCWVLIEGKVLREVENERSKLELGNKKEETE